MTYMNEYNPDKFEPIKDILEKIQDLSPGARITLKNFDCEEAKSKVRWLLYNWMYHNQLKPFYRIRQLPGELEIIKLGRLSGIKMDTVNVPLGARLDMILADMIKASDEDDATQVARARRDEGHITDEEFGLVVEKYGDIMK